MIDPRAILSTKAGNTAHYIAGLLLTALATTCRVCEIRLITAGHAIQEPAGSDLLTLVICLVAATDSITTYHHVSPTAVYSSSCNSQYACTTPMCSTRKTKARCITHGQQTRTKNLFFILEPFHPWMGAHTLKSRLPKVLYADGRPRFPPTHKRRNKGQPNFGSGLQLSRNLGPVLLVEVLCDSVCSEGAK